jgi:hypothetical protein
MRTLALVLLALPFQQPPSSDPFLQLKEGMTWTYVSGGAEGKVRVTGREKVGEVEAFVLTTENAGSSSEKETVVSDGAGIRLLKQTAGDRVTEHATPFVRLKLPAVKGEKWEWKGQMGKEQAAVTFTNDGEEDISVPAGKYKAWKVSVVIEIAGVKHTGANWFAPGVGIVRQQSTFESGGKKHESLIELKSFEPGK